MKRPLDEGDWNLAYLFPDEVAEARARTGLVLLPVAPIEWHGPHLAMGCDTLLAHAFARRLARALRSPYFPPLFVGTERERRPETLRSLGFFGTEFIEGMDFPGNSVKSAYVREDGDSFDGAPTPDFTVREAQDPRRHTDAAAGERYIEEAARETVAEIRATLLAGR